MLSDSASQRNPYAQYVLGKLYLQGKEVGQDQDTAEYWLTQSANQGNSFAQFLLDYRQRDPSVLLCTARLLHHMSNIFGRRFRRPIRRVVMWRASSCGESVRRRLRWGIRRMIMRTTRARRCPCSEFKICTAINKEYATGAKGPKCKSELSDNSEKAAGY